MQWVAMHVGIGWHTMPSMPRDGTVVNEVLDIMFKFEALVGFVTQLFIERPCLYSFWFQWSAGLQVEMILKSVCYVSCNACCCFLEFSDQLY